MAGKTARFIVKPKRVQKLVHHDLAKIGGGEGDAVLDNYMDNSLVPEADVVLLVNDIKKVSSSYRGYVEAHRHDATQLYAIIGDLTVEAFLDDERHVVKGPACIFVPAGMKHVLRETSGSGYIVVVVRQGNYE